jgi:aerobic-type carbon monoxide dehydrogenase small subunit (CoxS/CutS family)
VTNPVSISFTINSQAYTSAVDPSWDLQYFLHDILGYYDIKTFCYRGECGSCTVIMNSRPVLSCMTLAVDANGATIQTAQGIALSGHPLVAAYVQNHCMQCGYCTPGFICTSKALLDSNASPTVNDIIEALAGNLCRCGTYPQHVLAIQAAATALKGGS